MKTTEMENGWRVYINWDRIMEVTRSITTLFMQYISIPLAIVSPLVALGVWNIKPMVDAVGLCAGNYLLIRYFEWLEKRAIKEKEGGVK